MFNNKNKFSNVKRFNERNISDTLYEFYFDLAKVSIGRCSSKKKLDIIYKALLYINKNIDNFTVDELKLSIGMIKISNEHINTIKNYKSLRLPNLRYCDNLVMEIGEKIKEPKF